MAWCRRRRLRHRRIGNSHTVLSVTILGNSTPFALVTSGDHQPNRWVLQFLVNVLVQHSDTRNARHNAGQFSLRSLFVLLTLVAVFAAGLVAFRGPLAQFGYYPGVLGLIAITLTLPVPFVARHQRGGSTAWTLPAIAIQLTCFNLANTMRKLVQTAFQSYGIWQRDLMQEMFNHGIAPCLTLPLFAIVSAIIYLLAFYRWPSRSLALWLLASVVACVLATTALTLAISFSLGTLI